MAASGDPQTPTLTLHRYFFKTQITTKRICLKSRRTVDVSTGRRNQPQIQHRQRSTRGSKRSAPVLDPGVTAVNLILVGGLLILLPRAEPPPPIINVFNNVYSHKFLVSTVSTISR